MMDGNEVTMLQELGLGAYESAAYVALLSLGVAGARTICERSGVPSSKIYSIMDKFRALGMVEVQQSRPLKFRAADPVAAVDRLARTKEHELASFREALPAIKARLESIHSSAGAIDRPFFNLEFGMEAHIKRHLARLAEAESETCSYFEATCLKGARIYGSLVKQGIVRNILAGGVRARVLFGVDDASMAVGFVQGLPHIRDIEARLTGRIHAPFHVIDGRSVIMVIDNPLFRDGRVASVYATDRKLAREMRDGYMSMWESARPLLPP